MPRAMRRDASTWTNTSSSGGHSQFTGKAGINANDAAVSATDDWRETKDRVLYKERNMPVRPIVRAILLAGE